MTVALTSPQLSALRSATTGHRSKQYLSQVPDTAIATARINQASFTRPIAVLTVDTTSGWSNVAEDMTVWIGTTAGAKDIGAFRVRGSTATTLSISEFSPSDFGFLPVSELRGLADNAYITIVADIRATMKDPRIEYTGGLTGVFYKDGYLAYTDQNETGGDTPAVVNIGKHPAGWVDSTTGQLEHVWIASVTALEPGVTVSSYSWNLGGGDLHSGSLSVSTCTARYDPGHYLTSLTVTLSNGVVITVYRHVFAHDTSTYPPTPIDAIRSDRQTQLGRRMTIELTAPIDDYPLQNGLMVVVWEDARWGTTAINDAPLNFAGWATPHTGESLPGVNTSVFDIIGGLELLQGQRAYSQELTVAANPSNWQEVSESLSYIDFWLYYLLYYHTTLWRIFDIYLPGYTNRTMPVWAVQPGNIVEQLREAGQRMNVIPCQASNGAIWLKRDYHQLTQSERTGLLTRISLTSQDFSNLRYSKRYTPEVSRVEAEGFRNVGGQLTPLQAQSPGIKEGYGGGVGMLGGQMVSGQNELNERAAAEYAYLNMPIKTFTMEFQRNYDVIDPAWRMVVALSLAADEWPENVPMSGQLCEVIEIERRYLPGGAKDVIWTLEPEVIGYNTPGETIDIIGTQVDPEDLDIPTYDPITGEIITPYDPFDPGTYPEVDDTYSEDIALKTVLLAWTDDVGVIATNDPLRPIWSGLFDENEVVQMLLVDPQSPRLVDYRTGALAVYALTDAGLYYHEDVLDTAETWALQEALADFTIARAVRGVASAIGVYGPSVTVDAGAINVTFDGGSEWPDYTVSDGTIAAGGRSGNGLHYTTNTGNQIITFYIDFGTTTNVTDLSLYLYCDYNAPNADVSYDIRGSATAPSNSDRGLVSGDSATTDSAWTQVTYTLNWTGVRYLWIHFQDPAFALPDLRVDDVAVNTTLTTDEAAVAYSSDNGATMSVLPVGGSPTLGGYDVDDHNLGIHVASNGTTLRHTTSYTGTFATVTGITTAPGGTELCLVRVPFRRPSTNALNNSNTALHVIWAADDLISGASLWWGTLNESTSAVSNITDCTPVIGADTYLINGPHALEINAQNARLWLAFARIDGDTQIDLIFSDDAGGTWTVQQANFPGTFVRWVEGSLTEAFLGTEDGAYYTDDRGLTTVNVTTNLEDFDAVPVLGVIG